MSKSKSEKIRLYREADIDWKKLSAIGIERDDLEIDGHLDPLLRGERTGPVHYSLLMPGVDIELDATLQLFPCKGGSPVLEITGVGLAEGSDSDSFQGQ